MVQPSITAAVTTGYSDMRLTSITGAFMSTHAIAALAVATLFLPVHGHSVQVHTINGVGESQTVLRTVSVKRSAEFVGGVSPFEVNPLLDDEVTSQTIRRELVSGMKRHGYTISDTNPDAVMSYYLAVPDRDDVTNWDFGYMWRPSWWRDWGPGSDDASPAEYEYGAVIIELRDARSNEVIWRSHAEAPVPLDQEQYDKNLKTALKAILNAMPGQPTAGMT
jgi:uncharacterized protein DUF4136